MSLERCVREGSDRSLPSEVTLSAAKRTRGMLAEIRIWFTVVFETTDLRYAKVLLDELAE
jgi:hypothetical protein